MGRALRFQRQEPAKFNEGFGEDGLERVAGIEPAYSAWKAAALPLSYTRDVRSEDEWWRELDLNQRRRSQRIYSPSPLTTRASLQSIRPDQATKLSVEIAVP